MLKPPQMLPHRENNNDNNNNLYDVIQQLATGQAQLMQTMTQFIQASANNMNNNNPPPPPPAPQVDRLAHFLRLRPNKFSSAIDPIVADDWLRSVNKDLVTCECTDAEKIRFTVHLLEGRAAIWWETYQVTNPIEGLDWDSFREGFRNAHISTGIMNLKKDEFRTQGGRTLKEYMDDFLSLSRYAPEDINTNAKRKDKFLNGLKGELMIPLSVAYAPSYQALLDQAVTLDNNIRKEENRKRKYNNGKTYTEHSHKRHRSSEGNGNGNSNGHRHNGGNNGNHSNGHHNGDNGNHNGCNGNHNGGNGNQNGGNGHQNGGNGHQNGGNGQHRAKKDLSHITCYRCKKIGHFADMCPEKKLDDAAKPNPFQKGHVNHINVEEVMGTFPLNSFTTLDFI
jgi:hypothetical protein